MKFFIFATLLLTSTGVNAANGFAASCTEVSLSELNMNLKATCEAQGQLGQKPLRDASLDVSKCFSVDSDGKISCKKGDIGACKCKLVAIGSMSCKCNNSKKAEVQSTVNL
ncbi:hypothetical protein PspLS_07685, partial [Pyricularia sp. CBS 133598]